MTTADKETSLNQQFFKTNKAAKSCPESSQAYLSLHSCMQMVVLETSQIYNERRDIWIYPLRIKARAVHDRVCLIDPGAAQ